MKRIKIPHTNLEVSALCYGVGGFGTAAHGELTDRLLAQFLEAEGNFVDTAHCYGFWAKEGQGASERALGDSLRRLKAREKVVVATKGRTPIAGLTIAAPPTSFRRSYSPAILTTALSGWGLRRLTSTICIATTALRPPRR